MFGTPTFRRFLKYARPYWPWILGACFCGIFKFTLALSLPAALGIVVDHVFLAEGLSASAKLHRMLWVLGVLLLAYVGRAPATFYRSYFAAKAGHRTIFDIRRDLYRHIQRLSMAYHDKERTGSTISRLINDLNVAQGILNQGVIAMSMDAVFLIGVVVFLLWFDFDLALASLFVLPIYGIVFRYVNPRLRKAATQVQEEMEEMSGEVTEKLSGVQVVMSFVREKTEELNFFERHRRYYQKVLRPEGAQARAPACEPDHCGGVSLRTRPHHRHLLRRLLRHHRQS
jgi:subfamily B ATP-binding cassette protein MsbA